MITEIPVHVTDIEDVREILAACLNLLQARDLMEAQVSFTNTRYSPLTNEVGRVKTRFDGYFGDFLLAKHEAERDDEFEEEQEDVSTLMGEDALAPETGSEGLTEASAEDVPPLSGSPLGEPKVKRQKGRRVQAKRDDD